jgi:hypothetical protein
MEDLGDSALGWVSGSLTFKVCLLSFAEVKGDYKKRANIIF